MKNGNEELLEWMVDRKYGKYFPKDFFFSREERMSLDGSDNDSQRRQKPKYIPPLSSRYY
jgi:hypothetical protein